MRPEEETFHLSRGIYQLIRSLRQFEHQNVGHLRIGESGRLHQKVHEEGPEAEKIPRLFPVPHAQRPGGAFAATAAQR